MDVVWNRLGRSAWDAAVAEAPLEQHWAYGAVAARFGARVLRAQLDNTTHAQVILRRFGPLGVAWLPAGITRGTEEAFQAIRASLPVRGLTFALAPDPTERSEAATAQLDIRPDMQSLRAGLHQKWRNRLVRAEGAGIDVHMVRGCPDWVLTAEGAQRRVQRYRALPAGWTRAWARFAPDGVLTFEAHQRGRTIAATTFLISGRVARYHMGWSGNAGRAANAHNLLVWHAMMAVKGLGADRVDLGLVGEGRLAGLTRFKLGTGAALQYRPRTRLYAPTRRVPRHGTLAWASP